MTAPDPNQLTFNADQEHVGLRAVVLLLIAAWFVIGFFFFSAVFGQLGGLLAAYWLPLSCILGLIMALAVSWLAESLLKRYWPSGRRLVIDDEQLQAWLPGGETVRMVWSSHVWSTNWTFSLAGYPRGGRERRLTKRHYCLACQLQQDKQRVIVYGYLKGNEAGALLDGEAFHEIEPAEHYERGPLRFLRGGAERPKLPAKILSGKDGRYWLAEQRRWSEGIELTPGDFLTFWETVKDRLEGGRLRDD